MPDPYAFHSPGPDNPAVRQAAMTPGDTADLQARPRLLYCQTAGNVARRDEAGVEVTCEVTAGQVMATGPTAAVLGWL